MFDEPGMSVLLYKRPHGHVEELWITKINQEEVDYFTSNNIQVSMEDCGVFFTIYAANGAEDSDEEPNELTLIVGPDETCYDAMARLRAMCEKAVEDGHWERSV